MRGRPLSLLLAALLCGCEPPPPRAQLEPHELAVQLRTLAAVAAEADLLAQQLEAHRLNGSFAWVHQQSLADAAGRAASAIAIPAPATLQPAQAAGLALAGELRLALPRTAHAQYDDRALQALRARFTGLRADARRLAGSVQ